MTTRLRIVETPFDLAVGSLVVYGGHGLGFVAGRSPSDGEAAEAATIVLELRSGLSVSLPLERAESCLRPPCDARTLEDVRAVLRSPNTSTEQSWQARTRTMRAKITAGEAVGLAEVVRDTVERLRRCAARPAPALAEQQLYRKARRLLAAELAVAADTDEAEAENWIESHLDRNGK